MGAERAVPWAVVDEDYGSHVQAYAFLAGVRAVGRAFNTQKAHVGRVALYYSADQRKRIPRSVLDRHNGCVGDIDIPWALSELHAFLKVSALTPVEIPGVVYFGSAMGNAGSPEEIVALAQVTEKILDRVLPRWRTTVPADDNEHVNSWCQHREAA